MKKIFCLAFVLLLCLSIFPFSVLASESDIGDSFDFSESTIEEDFSKAFCGLYSVGDFVENLEYEDLVFITLFEGCSKDDSSVELYFYVYNPSRKAIVKDSPVNILTLASFVNKDDPEANDYDKHAAVLVDTYAALDEAGDTTDALLLKYEVKLGSSYNVSTDRYYRVSEFELLVSGNSNATAFLAGKEFRFFNGENFAINCTSTDLATVEMDAYHTFYRVDTEGVDRYTDIQSIYFPVSNELLKIYGGMYSLDLIWYKDTLNPGLVVDSSVVRDAFQYNWINNRGLSFKYSLMYDRNCPSYPVIEMYRNGVNVSALSSLLYADWVCPSDTVGWYYWKNHKLPLYPDVCGPKVESNVTIGSVFYAHDVTTFEAVSVYGEDVLDYINTEKDRDSLYASKQQEPTNITFNVEMVGNNYDVYVPRLSWLHNFAFWNWNTDKDTGENLDVSVFEKINLSDLEKLSVKEFSEKYFVDINDVKCNTNKCGNCINCRVNDEQYKDCVWYLLRYDTTYYQSYDAIVIDNETGNASFNIGNPIYKIEDEPCNAVVFETQMIRDLDTVSITFRDVKGGVDVYRTFPILRSPTSFVADIWNPTEKPHFDFDIFGDGSPDWWEKLFDILKIVAAILVSVIVLRIVLPVFVPIVNAVKRRKKERKNKK